jgi:hypothetical protein
MDRKVQTLMLLQLLLQIVMMINNMAAAWISI